VRGSLSKLAGMKIEKGWQWLLYLDVLLPGLLYLLAFLMPAGIAVNLARLFHSYSMYVSNPIPNVSALMGLVGLALHLGVLGQAAKRRDWKDFVLSLALTLAVVFYYYQGLNYDLVRYLSF